MVVFSNAMNRGDDTFSHPTQFGEIYGQNIADADWPEDENLQYVQWMAQNTKALLDQNINIMDLLATWAHHHGMQFWPSLRMNDIHEDDRTRFSPWHSDRLEDTVKAVMGQRNRYAIYPGMANESLFDPLKTKLISKPRHC